MSACQSLRNVVRAGANVPADDVIDPRKGVLLELTITRCIARRIRHAATARTARSNNHRECILAAHHNCCHRACAAQGGLHQHLLQLPQPVQHCQLAGFLQLASNNVLIQDGVHLVKVEHQIQLAHVAEKAIQHLHKQVDALQVCQLVVGHVHAEAEEQACVPPVNDLICAKLQRAQRCGMVEMLKYTSYTILYVPVTIRLSGTRAHLDKVCELRVPRCHKAVHLILYLPLVALFDGDIPLGQASLALPILQQEKANLQVESRRRGSTAATSVAAGGDRSYHSSLARPTVI